MKEGPDITRLAALIGDPARSNILCALMGGKALTAGELAAEAGITPATASSHLAQLTEADLLWPRKQGRHRYYALKGAEVAEAIEALTNLAAAKGHMRCRTGPRDAGLREARVCYDHLAGSRAVRMFESLAQRGFMTVRMDEIALTDAGADFVAGLGVDMGRLGRLRRPLCRVCLDWSERRSHLGGALGAALLQRFQATGWIRRTEGSREVSFTPSGAAAFDAAFGAAA